MQEKRELYINDTGAWSLYPYLITCTDDGQQVQKYDDDIEFYERMVGSRSDFKLDEVIRTEYTSDQTARLEEVQGIEYRHYDEIYDYVMEGIIQSDSVVFANKNMAKLKEENTMLEGTVMELTNILTMVIGGQANV